jgi:alpha-L-rhamnosidase
MRRWVEYMRNHSRRYIWSKGHHFGDWLCLDKDIGGKPTSNAYIATAFGAYSTGLFVKAGKVLGKDMREYETLAKNIRAAFRKKFLTKGRVKENTQTACALALYFDLADDKPAVAAQLNALVKQYGHLTTGFVGTPYLLHVLTENGYAETAYDLLLREEYPSWLYPVGLGATTMWERWNGIWPDGSMADKGMNSFNHYAYGAVGDWMYGTMAGINTDENAPGFKHIVFKPVFDKRFVFVNARIVTGYGEVSAGWKKVDNGFVYTVTVPEGCAATVFVGGTAREVEAGTHSLNA